MRVGWPGCWAQRMAEVGRFAPTATSLSEAASPFASTASARGLESRVLRVPRSCLDGQRQRMEGDDKTKTMSICTGTVSAAQAVLTFPQSAQGESRVTL